MIFDLYFYHYIQQFRKLKRPHWNYEDGCVLTALQYMYEVTEDQIFFESIKEYFDNYIQNDGSILYYHPEEYSLDSLPAGRVLCWLYKRTGILKYKKAAELLMMQLATQPRTDSGSFWHKGIYPYQIWLDGIYMACPFYLVYDVTFCHGQRIPDIMHQFENARKYLYDNQSGLYRHAYDEKKCQFWADRKTGLSPNFWSRAMGWFIMALVDCYEKMPEKEQQYRQRLAELLREALDGIYKVEDEETGMLWQLTSLKDVSGNYLESSASAMTAYTIMKGCRMGILNNTYLTNAIKIMIYLEQNAMKVENNVLKLTGICAGAGLGPAERPQRDGSISYYLKEPCVSDEQKGVAAVMMAYSEWLRWKEKGAEWKKMITVELQDVYKIRHLAPDRL